MNIDKLPIILIIMVRSGKKTDLETWEGGKVCKKGHSSCPLLKFPHSNITMPHFLNAKSFPQTIAPQDLRSKLFISRFTRY